MYVWKYKIDDIWKMQSGEKLCTDNLFTYTNTFFFFAYLAC